MAVYLVKDDGRQLSRLSIEWTKEGQNVIGQLEVIRHLIDRTRSDAVKFVRANEPVDEISRLLDEASTLILAASTLVETSLSASA